MTELEVLKDFWLKVGDKVEHVKEVGSYGIVTHIDANLIPGYGVTTCLVLWEGETVTDIQWTNKLTVVQ